MKQAKKQREEKLKKAGAKTPHPPEGMVKILAFSKKACQIVLTQCLRRSIVTRAFVRFIVVMFRPGDRKSVV